MIQKTYVAGILVVLFLFSGYIQSPLLAQDRPQELFNRGNFFLEQGNYKEALNIYRDIERRQVTSGALYLNMGISYAYLDSLGLAKYYFLKATNHSATRARATEGIEFVEAQLNMRRGALPRLSWIMLSEWLHFEVDTRMVIISGIFLFNAGIFLVILTWFKSSIKHYFKPTGIVFTGFGAVLVAGGLILDMRSEDYIRAVMVDHQTEMRSHPDENNEVIGLIFEGYTFTLDISKSREYDGWKFARLSNGLSGWIDEQVIREL